MSEILTARSRPGVVNAIRATDDNWDEIKEFVSHQEYDVDWVTGEWVLLDSSGAWAVSDYSFRLGYEVLDLGVWTQEEVAKIRDDAAARHAEMQQYID